MVPTVPIQLAQAVVKACFEPTKLSNSEITLHKNDYGIAAIYTCHFGYRFANGGLTRTTVCVDGEWNTEMADCEGLIVFHFFAMITALVRLTIKFKIMIDRRLYEERL